MDEKKSSVKQDVFWGCIYLVIFVILIFLGIYVKRALGHPEFMMVFHGPAAVFLVLGGLKVTSHVRLSNQQLIRELELSIRDEAQR